MCPTGVAVVHPSTDVRAGENGGRVLEHSHVVRAYKAVPVDTDLAVEVRLRIPGDTTAAALDAIVYVQDRATLAVLGAVSVTFKGGD